MKRVEDIRVSGKTEIRELLKLYEKMGGFVAKKLADAFQIMERILDFPIRIISFPACLVATGLRGVIRDAIRDGIFNLIFTTCGTLDHDLARSFKPYYHGDFLADDRELRKRGISRLGNVFVPDSSYGEVIEEKLQPLLEELYSRKRDWAGYEFCWELGKTLPQDSILYWAWKKQVPVIVPGITDGAVG
ncbi:MAG: deoxyhypusine synthase, partial [Candidatus Aenigmatarchaeota archaeon]